ncbi:SDR family NAD(P)-dependent oxidoreductase [Streptomyces sp. B1866]|uniref:SDR family oxidoreductase n=1 Tax=Streptomyces sp. B1866 TaxID=3075431 RepID=UPI00288DE352|nr:SDR family NAD(P)-dependent oxidoreductase [Streptomyces sp. B1866]MDT3396931.1 SDR family NAD(P)-dependent oxidoreductase [Streptomyces sp. B1866]
MTARRDVALVTGAGGGICAEVARGLAARGLRLVLLDQDAEAVRRVADGLAGRLVCDPLVADVTDARALESAIGSIPSEHRPGVLVNGVGGDTRARPVTELTEADLQSAVAHNLAGVFTATRLCAPAMVAAGWGRIVNLASVAGRTYTRFSNAAYVAAKAGVIGFTKQCAFELAPHGVTVNAVAHGVIGTDRIRRAWADKPARWTADRVSRIPAGRFGTVAEAAGIVCHLCGEDAGYTTGAVVDVNGGLHI